MELSDGVSFSPAKKKYIFHVYLSRIPCMKNVSKMELFSDLLVFLAIKDHLKILMGNQGVNEKDV